MIKTAVVEIGKTPSALSGKPSDAIECDEALCKEACEYITKDLKDLMEQLELNDKTKNEHPIHVGNSI